MDAGSYNPSFPRAVLVLRERARGQGRREPRKLHRTAANPFLTTTGTGRPVANFILLLTCLICFYESEPKGEGLWASPQNVFLGFWKMWASPLECVLSVNTLCSGYQNGKGAGEARCLKMLRRTNWNDMRCRFPTCPLERYSTCG